MQNVAQSWLVYRLTHSELLLGTAWFCSQIAVFALGPLGGIAADRFSRQKVVIVTQTLSMVQAFVLAALTLTGRVQVWHVLVLAGLLGVINAFDMPGRQALVIQMTSKEDLHQRHLAELGRVQCGARGGARPSPDCWWRRSAKAPASCSTASASSP